MIFFAIATLLILANFFLIKNKITFLRKKPQENKFISGNSLASHYGYCSILWSLILISALFFFVQNLILVSQIILLILTLVICSLITIYLAKKQFHARNHLENFIKILLIISAATGIIITLLITVSILFEAIKFFKLVGIAQFLFGTKWNPQIAIYEGQAVGESAFGMIPVFLGTLLITLIAIIIAAPIGLFAAIYIAEYAGHKLRNLLKPTLEILAGIPTVVYGYFAAIIVAPFFHNFFARFNIDVASESALAAGLVMGIMIIPFILSLSEDAISSVSYSLRDGALALGSTKSEMIKKVILPTALPNIVSGILLAISRAIGETMIVTMAAGLIAKMTFNPLASVTTATAQIVTLLVGDQEADSPKTLAAFALGLVLFIMTLVFNIIALITVRKYQEKYE